MARANRHFLPGHVWHITHRCHQKQFLLKFARDRQHYLRWVFEAKKRFGLLVLNYIVTCNHVPLLVNRGTSSGRNPRIRATLAGPLRHELIQGLSRLFLPVNLD